MKNKPIEEFSAGDLVKIKLIVNSRNNEKLIYIIIEDFLPSSFAPQNPRLENGSERERRWWGYEMDIRDERVVFCGQSLE